MANEQNLKPFQNGNDPRRNLDGRPKGRKNLATIVRELEEEEFDWDKLPLFTDEIAASVSALKKYGSPWRALVMRAFLDAMAGDTRAMEYLRKSGYGDKLDVTSDGKVIQHATIINFKDEE